MRLTLDKEVRERFPDLKLALVEVRGVVVKKQAEGLNELKQEVLSWVRENYRLETLKDVPIFRLYRDFFWRLNIDPTKIRPASEALVRRVLQGKSLPNINTVVDAYNLASIKTGVPLAVFDAEKLKGDLMMRFARKGEKFLGIGMKEPVTLKGGELVIADEEKLIAIYPYRDSDEAKVTESTTNILVVSCGVPGVDAERLRDAAKTAVDFIGRFCGGAPGDIILVGGA